MEEVVVADRFPDIIELYAIIMDMLSKFFNNEASSNQAKEELIKKLSRLKDSSVMSDNDFKKIVDDCKNTLKNIHDLLAKRLKFSTKTALYEVNKPCQNCISTDSETTMLKCGHYFCKSCLFEASRKGGCVNKCRMEECYHVMGDEELKAATGVKGEKKKFVEKLCVFCSKEVQKTSEKEYKADDPGIACSKNHYVCQACFKKYGEYETNYEILIVQSINNGHTTYQRIACPVPECDEELDAEVLLEMHPQDKEKLREDANKRFEALNP